MWKALRIAHYLGEGGEKNRVPFIHKPRQLRMLAKSKDAGLRYSVARSRYTSLVVLQILMTDESWPVRMAVACNPNVSFPILEFLSRDPELVVREKALSNSLFRKHQDIHRTSQCGPYIPNQEPFPCGCYYPDVTRIYDTCSGMIVFCQVHGPYGVTRHIGLPLPDIQPIPDDKFRESARKWLRSKDCL